MIGEDVLRGKKGTRGNDLVVIGRGQDMDTVAMTTI